MSPAPFGDDRDPPGVSLVGYWKLDEAVGPMAADSSGLGNHGLHESGPMPSDVVAPVSFANARSLAFEQPKRHDIAVPDSPSLRLAGPLTLAAWIRPTGDTSEQQGIVEKWEIDQATGRVSRGYEFRLSFEREIRVVLLNEPGHRADLTGTTAVPLNAWTHVAATFDGKTLRAFVNGVQDGEIATTLVPARGTNKLHIGRDYGSNAFQGNIDDVRVYSRALTRREISALAGGGNVAQ